MFDILVLCYGDYPHLAKRCLGSIIDNGDIIGHNIKIHVGMNKCGKNTKLFLQDLLNQKYITTIINSDININKDPMMRKLIGCVNSDYFIWFDDDSYIGSKDWDKELINQISCNPGVDIFGFAYYWKRDDEYMAFLRNRPWYDKTKPNKKAYLKIKEKIMTFPVGGVWVAKKDFLVKNNYPDELMTDREHQHMDDRLLGDLILLKKGKFRTLFGWETTFLVSKADRRGS